MFLLTLVVPSAREYDGIMFRSLARPLLASWFVYDGLQNALEPQVRAKTADVILAPVYDELELSQPVPTEMVVRVHAIATVGAAVLLATSRTPRTAGVALAGLAALQLAVAPRFWTMPEGPLRDAAMGDFIKQTSLLGGTMLAASTGHTTGHKRRKKARRAKGKSTSSALVRAGRWLR